MPDVPIAAVTAHALPDDRERALEAGCDAVLTKPYLIGDLLACVEMLVAGSLSMPPAAGAAEDRVTS
jgi:CheY-like chemotaxis protein